VRLPQEEPTPQRAPGLLQRQPTMYGEEWKDEVGGPEDFKAIGKYVGELLSKNHYKWISHRSEIESLLEQLLPALSVENKDAYDKQIHDLEMAAHHLQACAT